LSPNYSRRDFDLYLITNRHQTLNRPLTQVLEDAIFGGVESIQLREKDLSVREFLSLAFEVRELTRRKSLLFINDRVDVCLTTGADGVHLRSDSMPPSAARKILGKKKMIGVSCHNLSEVLFAEEEGADFVTLGPLLFTPSKQGFGDPLGFELFQSIAERAKIPVFALGGVRLEHVQSAIRAGAYGIAVISAILSVPEVKKVTEELLRELRKIKSGR
jgi:thiamine-phosphate pyrophosphorylase